jgi:hypothetical protein
MKPFLKLFLANGIPFGIMIGASVALGWFGPEGGVLSGLVAGPIAGLVFGLLTAIVLGGLNDLILRDRPESAREAGPRYSDTFTVTAPAEAALDRAFGALKALGAEIGRQDRAQGRIVGRTAISLHGWGERVTVQVVANTAPAATVTVPSAPLLFPTVIDCGRGVANVEAVAARLKA